MRRAWVSIFHGVSSVRGSYNFADSLIGSNNGFTSVENFEGRAGNDFIDGRGGNDRVVYNNDLATTSASRLTWRRVPSPAMPRSGPTRCARSSSCVAPTSLTRTPRSASPAIPPALRARTLAAMATSTNSKGMGGNDSITGNGNTRVSYSQALSGVTADIAAGTGFSTTGVTQPMSVSTRLPVSMRCAGAILPTFSTARTPARL